MFRSTRAALGFILLAASAVHADVIVPNSAAGVEADGAFALTATATAGRTFQMTIAASQLSGLVGQQIVGLQWRLNGAVTAAWPPANVTYSQWDVFIGPGVAPSSMSNTFASNFSGPATQVRSGGWSVNAGSFTSGASPNAFGPTLDFTSPFLYTGGDLTVEMRFSNQVGTTTTPSFDATLVSGGPANGWGVDFAARWTSSSTGTTGSNGNFLVTNFVVPAPSSLALLGLSLGVVSRRPSRRR